MLRLLFTVALVRASDYCELCYAHSLLNYLHHMTGKRQRLKSEEGGKRMDVEVTAGCERHDHRRRGPRAARPRLLSDCIILVPFGGSCST